MQRFRWLRGIWMAGSIVYGQSLYASLLPQNGQPIGMDESRTAQTPSLKELLAQKQDRRRVVLLYGREADNSDLVTQQNSLRAQHADMTERDLDVIVRTDANLSPADRSYLTQHFKLASGSAFQGWLIGKDGGMKHTFRKPINPRELTQIIDQMPMRQSEMRRKN